MNQLDKNNDLAFNNNTIQKNCPIKPPSSPQQSHSYKVYNLFDTKSRFSINQNHDLWGRSTTITSIVCALCLNTQSHPISPSCGKHHFCQSCLTTQNLHYLLQGVCPVCVQVTDNISDPTTMVTPSRSFSTTPPLLYPCIKLTNIPWDVSQNDIRYFFGNCRFPSPKICIQSIHIMMDRTTGKTLSDAYIEFATMSDMRRAIETRNQKPLKGRIVSVSECSQEELLAIVFPKWRGQFQGVSAIPPTTEIVKTMSTAAGGGNSGCPPFITREEINSLLVVCKNYKLHFSRKCAERPFENIISVIAKYPWHQSHLISTMHRDHIYEMLKLSIESIKTHLAKDYVQIDPTLLERLTRAGIMCPAFTERQKMTLLQTARIECPQDILPYLIPYMPTSPCQKSPKSIKKPHHWDSTTLVGDTESMDEAILEEPISFEVPLLFTEQQTEKKALSPWAPSFEAKTPSDIWGTSNHSVDTNRSKSLLAA